MGFKFNPLSGSFDIDNDVVGSVTVQDIDGNPTVTDVSTLKFTNGSVTDNGDGTVSIATGAGGGGDVSGPASATDNAVTRFDGTGGKTIQNSGVIISDNQDITAYDATNDGNPVFSFGASATERLTITPTYDTGAQTVDLVEFATAVASASADKGKFRFDVDGTDILDIDDGGINFAASKGISIAGTDILTDSAGTATLSNIDAIDATTEATIEAAIDTLANLTSIQGRTVTLADAGADAILGWDDSASAYQNLSAADALAALGVTAAAAELNYVDGVTSAIQTQIDAKAAGAASSTDNAIARFDGAGGKTLQNSGVTISDTNEITTAASVTAADFLLSSGGSATDPSIRTTGDPELGIYFTGTTLIGFAQGGATMGTFNNSGFQIGGSGARVTTVLDEDDMTSNSATALATQQSIKAYADLKAPIASPTFTGTVTLPKTTEINDTTGDHQYVLAVSELAADRTVTLPLLGGADEFVFKDHAVTLTNKTVALGSNTVSGTKAQFDTAVTDGNIMFDGDSITNATAGNWKVFYSDGSGVITELGLGADGTFLKSNGAAAAPTFATPSGSGDVSKVGTPVDGQIGVWTGDGTIEGDAALTFDTSTNTLSTDVLTLTGTGTLNGLDALDATSEATIEAAIDTLANLTSIQGRTITLTDELGDRFFGWDDSANAYEALDITEVRAIIGTTSDLAVGLVELATDAETVTGTDTGRATTPANITARLAAPGTIGGTTPGAATFTTATINTGITLAENASLALDPAGSADGKYSGITITGTAGTALAFGDLVYLAAADSRWELADADAASTSGDVQLGMCVLAAAGDGSATNILLYGNIRADAAFPALTIGGPAYVGTTAGDIQTAQPSGTDDVIRRVGFALTADELLFNPSNDYVTHT